MSCLIALERSANVRLVSSLRIMLFAFLQLETRRFRPYLLGAQLICKTGGAEIFVTVEKSDVEFSFPGLRCIFGSTAGSCNVAGVPRI